ncbi:hypothetical protein [Pleomorphomonas oryzae]|uniref:hypothetical protein n=1 Tax=Pleomorphomonas oryzae TaxID=261934 RepID=UPI00047DE2D9|nr:hypothetical protein [Pleomorphomonas oryzae]
MEDPEAVLESERLYNFIGKYVISFQWLEGKIDEIYFLAKGAENRMPTIEWLSKKTIAQKIDGICSLIHDGETFRPVKIDGWYDKVSSVVARLHQERDRRNSILHSKYLFDFLAIGIPVLRTRARRQNEVVSLDQEYLSPDRCRQIMDEIGFLSFDLNMIFVQLLHVYNYEKEN